MPAAPASGPDPSPGPRRPAAAGAAGERLAARTVALYGAPMLGLGFAFFLCGIYLLKFATDELGIAPATMGLLLLASRIWDAFSDPLAGFLSDRTRTRFGRRRPWMALGAPLVALAFVLLWMPPASLPPGALTLWVGVAVVLFYTATTVYGMPFDALGAELSTDYHERTRLYGVKRFCFGLGAVGVFLAMDAIAGAADPRAAAAAIAVPAAALACALMWLPVVGLRERIEYQGRGAARPLHALADVWSNPHARRLLVVFFLQQLGVAAVTVMAPYFAEYVLGDPGLVTWILAAFFLVSIVSIPVWIRLGQRVDKRTLLLGSMCVVALAMMGFLFVQRGMWLPTLVVAGLAGAAGGCLDVVLPSLQADVIDTDEFRTGERKEGVFFAAWHFAAKTAVGLSGMVVGFLLQSARFVPNAVQEEGALWMIRALTGGFPLLCFGAGTLVFLGFALTREAHASVRLALDARSAQAARGTPAAGAAAEGASSGEPAPGASSADPASGASSDACGRSASRVPSGP